MEGGNDDKGSREMINIQRREKEFSRVRPRSHWFRRISWRTPYYILVLADARSVVSPLLRSFDIIRLWFFLFIAFFFFFPLVHCSSCGSCNNKCASDRRRIVIYNKNIIAVLYRLLPTTEFAGRYSFGFFFPSPVLISCRTYLFTTFPDTHRVLDEFTQTP